MTAFRSLLGFVAAYIVIVIWMAGLSQAQTGGVPAAKKAATGIIEPPLLRAIQKEKEFQPAPGVLEPNTPVPAPRNQRTLPDVPTTPGQSNTPNLLGDPSRLQDRVEQAANKVSGVPGSTNPGEGPRVDPNPGTGPATSITGSSGQAGAVLNASTAGDLLNKSATSVGVDVQRRNGIVVDPRIRGLRSTQFLTTADGGLFYPGRLDLDSAIAKFDPGSIRDVVVIKGPYSALYGPGFSFLDVATMNSPRYNSFQVHGRTSGSYQTNGERWDALQSISVGDQNWGFRGTYDILQGNDYRSGDGLTIPSSYQSQNFNYALGFDINEKSSIELKGLRVIQNNLEFPGLYFDIRHLDTEAYNVRYTLRDQGFFDRLTFDVWYNMTAANGDTRSSAKQAFVQKLLAVSFNPTAFPGNVNTPPGPGQFPLGAPISVLSGNSQYSLFQDFSTTQFAERSIGYRLATSWGPDEDPNLTIGTDLNVFGQGLTESILLQQYQGPNLNTGAPTSITNPAYFTQNQSIPNSNSVNPGLFIQGKYEVNDRLTLRSGGRVDWVYTSSNPREITGTLDLFGPPGFKNPGRFELNPIVYSSNPLNPALSRDYGLFSAFVRSEYKLDDNWTALLAYGHAERAPTLTELYASGPFIGVLQQGTSRLIGDPNLKSEKLNQIDLGLTADYGVVQAGATVFYAWINDYITYDANKTGPGLTQVVYTNTDLATLAGVELFTQADVTSWLTPFATLSYVQGTDQTASDRRRPANLESSRRNDPLTLSQKAATEALPQIPPLESRLGLRFHEASKTPKWQLEFNARIVTGQNNVATSLGELPTPGFTVFNVRGYYRLSDMVLVSAGAENIGDKNYREHLDPISGNILNQGLLFRPGANFFFNTQITY